MFISGIEEPTDNIEKCTNIYSSRLADFPFCRNARTF
jgi:hypothetical protein